MQALRDGEFTQSGSLVRSITAAVLDDEGTRSPVFFTRLEPAAWLRFGIVLTVVGLVIRARGTIGADETASSHRSSSGGERRTGAGNC